MGYYSDVKIMIAPKAFEFLKETLTKSEDKNIRAMITNDNILNKNDSYVLIGWNYVKWYQNFDDVKAVMNVLNKLDSLVENEPEKLKDYFYKLIQIGEDNCTEEYTNDEYNNFVGDFYVEVNFSM